MSNHKKNQKDNIIITVIKFLIPYILINVLIFITFTDIPKIIIDSKQTEDTNLESIDFHIESLLPIIDVKISNDEKFLPFTKSNNGYTIPVTDSGTYTISALSLNQVTSTHQITFNVVDNTAPTIDLSSAVSANGIFSIKFNDEGSGINFDEVYLLTSSNEKIHPLNVDRTTNMAQFQINDIKAIKIHIEDMSGNASETSFTLT